MGGILFIECKVLECGWVVGRLWSVLCGRVPKFGSGIRLSWEWVPNFNNYKKFQVFDFFFNPVVPARKE
jgi:hypothetical protein